MPTRTRVYFDASVYVTVFLGEDEPDFAISEAAITAAEQGAIEGAFSGLVMAETVGAPRIRVGDGTQADRDRRLGHVVEYFKASRFLYVEESRRAGERAIELAVDFDLRGPDAMHVALAELAGCGEFY